MDAMQTAVTLTISEAAAIFEPPIPAAVLQGVVAALGWQPDEHRRTGRAGRPSNAYNATRLMQLHAALVPFTTDNVI